jgi:hypothetical protein
MNINEAIIHSQSEIKRHSENVSYTVMPHLIRWQGQKNLNQQFPLPNIRATQSAKNIASLHIFKAKSIQFDYKIRLVRKK